MLRIKNEQNDITNISFEYKLSDEIKKEFSLNRRNDEDLASAFQKIRNGIDKSVNHLLKKAKHSKIDNLNENGRKSTPTVDEQDLAINLFDLENNLIALTTKNKDAWKDNFTFKVNDQEFKVIVNLPTIKKIALSKLLIAGMPAIAKIETDSQISNEQLSKFYKFSWYKSVNTFENPVPDTVNSEKIKLDQNELNTIEWKLMADGVDKRLCVLDEDCENRLIKIECIPNDGSREGLAVQQLTNYLVNKKLDLINFPMTDRHKLTKEKLTDKKYIQSKKFFSILKNFVL